MNDEKTAGKRKLALKLTWVCAISFLIGGSWAWFIVSGGGPEALGAIVPMMAVGAIHIFLGPMAILSAFKSTQFEGKKYVYLYFLLYFTATTVLLSHEAIVYSVLFFVAVITPLVFSVVSSLAKGARKR